MIRGRFRRLIGDATLLSQVLRLGTRTALSQAVLVVAIPATTRLYTPAEFGEFGMFMSFLSVAALALCLRFDTAIASVSQKRQAAALLVVCVALILPMSILSTVVLWVMWRNDWLSFGSLPLAILPMMVAALFATGLFIALRFWLAQQLRFRELGSALLRQSIGRAVAPIVFGLSGFSQFGLVAGEIIGRSFAIRQIAVDAIATCRRLLRRCDGRYYSLLIRRNWKYPGILLPSSVLDAAAAAMPVPLLWTLFGPDVAGYFALVGRIASVPGSVVAASVADVLQGHLARSVNVGVLEARRQLLSVAGALSLAGAAIFVPIALLARWGVPAVFGDQWQSAGILLAILSPAFLAAFVVSPLSRALVVVNRLELKPIADVALLVLPVVALLSFEGQGWLRAMVAFSVANVLAYIIYFSVILFAMNRGRRRAPMAVRGRPSG